VKFRYNIICIDTCLVGIIESNIYVVTIQAPLNNHAKINKNEFTLYMHYVFIENEKESWHLNTIYHYASLDALFIGDLLSNSGYL